MTDEQKEFLEKNFKKGEFSLLSLMVRNEDLNKFIEYLKGSGLNMVILPKVEDEIDWADDGEGPSA